MSATKTYSTTLNLPQLNFSLNVLAFSLNRVRLIFLKLCRENISFFSLMFGELELNHVAQQISPAHRTIYFLQLLVTNLLSKTQSSQAQLTY